MKTLPVLPVETLAMHRTAAQSPTRNPGIVPPWLQHDQNTGIVPPWLEDDGIVPPWLEEITPATRAASQGRNPGIVPPWLQGRPVGPDAPVGDDVPRILAAQQATGFDATPVEVIAAFRPWTA